MTNGDAKPDEAELVERAAAGDETAFDELLARYRSVLTRYAQSRLSPAIQRKVSAADVVQEAGLLALRRLAEFEGGEDESFRRWLMRIVHFKAREAVQRHSRVRKRDVGRELTRGRRPATQQVQGRRPSPSQVAMAGELEARAREVMETLPDHYREVLRMARLEQMTLREIAERQGRSREAVKKTYARALARFRAALEGYGGVDA